jgi:putative transposase
MTAYRRNFVPGGCFFFTINLAERKLSLLADHVELLRAAFRETRQRHPFTIDAIVVLPDHLHTVWTLPEGDADFATRWQLIKSAFSRRLARSEQISRSRSAKGERGIWQRRYWEHTIRDEIDFARHVDYVHINPVKHRLVDQIRWSLATILPIGQAISRMMAAITASGDGEEMGFARAQPILRAARGVDERAGRSAHTRRAARGQLGRGLVTRETGVRQQTDCRAFRSRSGRKRTSMCSSARPDYMPNK